MVDNVKKFVQRGHNQGYEFKVFIDGGYGTEEATDKFKSRYAQRIIKAEKNVPNGIKELLGSSFKKAGIEVHYSKFDNDDTLATFAYLDGANVLSKDKDFHRYYKNGEKLFKIYRQWDVIQNQLIFELAKPYYFD